jgi:spore coat polysaccharide biosynthesis protein SpsF (cytidylyltransferase family)
MTLDYEDDFKFFKNIIEHFGSEKIWFIGYIHYINHNPDVAKINNIVMNNGLKSKTKNKYKIK